MKKFFVIAAVALTLIAAQPVTAQSKIGYISTEELISIMPETIKADSNLSQFRNALYQNAQEKQNALETAIGRFNKDSATMTQARKDVQRTELQKMLQDLQGEEQRINQQLQQKGLPEPQEQLKQRIQYTDQKIDKLVYELYGLSEEEIAIVEGR